MPVRPKRPCRAPGCKELVDGGYCVAHKKAQDEKKRTATQYYDKARGTASARGYDWRWTRYSKQYRKENPLCVDCLAAGVLTSVEHGGHVDHIIAVSGPDDPRFWEPSNHASRCRPCHSAKTAREDRGFGNKRRMG